MRVSTLGVDLAKNVFQVHGGDEAGEVVVRKTLRRRQMTSIHGNHQGQRSKNRLNGAGHKTLPDPVAMPQKSLQCGSHPHKTFAALVRPDFKLKHSLPLTAPDAGID